MGIKQHIRAFEAFQQAVLRNSSNPHYWTAIGGLYFQMNQPRDALDSYIRAIRLNPNLSEVLKRITFESSSCIINYFENRNHSNSYIRSHFIVSGRHGMRWAHYTSHAIKFLTR